LESVKNPRLSSMAKHLKFRLEREKENDNGPGNQKVCRSGNSDGGDGAASHCSNNDVQIDPAHTAAQFAVKHLMISTVRGEFKGVTGTVNWDDADITKSTIDVTIETKTVTTGEEKRDQHLKSPIFLMSRSFRA